MDTETVKTNNENEKDTMKRKKKIRIALIVAAVLIIGLGATYAWLTLTVKGENKLSMTAGPLKVYMDKESEGITLPDVIPTRDEDGLKGDVYTFDLVNDTNYPVNYKIYIDNDDGQKDNLMDAKNVRYQFFNNGVETISNLSDENEGRLVGVGTLRGHTRYSYSLRIWLDIKATDEVVGKNFYGKIRIYAEQEPGKVDVASKPVLADNMIPVHYNATQSRWEKASSSKEWYDYDKQEWANAVTVTAGTRDTYQKAAVGTEVKMEDILQMFVWIPRYSYTIKDTYGKGGTNAANPGEIDVEFISKSMKDVGTATYTGDTVTNWYTPPGFTFGSEELPGVWIGKFETGYSETEGTGTSAATTAAAQKDVVEPNKVIIKPNVYSWRSIRVSTLDLVSRQITLAGNVFGFDQTTYDAHAMKNTEWALISYITQSKYGKYGNKLYTGENKQVYMNNFNGYKTGRSSGQGTASSSAEEGSAYDDLVDRGEGQGYAGAGASSTGNITGIYDVNGGAWEYTMGVLEKRSGNTTSANSGYPGLLTDGSQFTGDRVWPDEKYYDVYTSTSTATACNGKPCKGHALNEVAGWYGDDTWMVNATEPWFVRGGSYDQACGSANSFYSFRQVLAPNGSQ